MATKSNNTQGNPYHDEEGKFTTPGDTGTKSPELQQSGSLKLQLKPGVDLTKIRTGLKIKSGQTFEGLADRLKDLNKSSDVPKLTSARDIESHITEFFSKQVIGKIDALYGSSSDCASYQFHPKSNPCMTLEIFPNVLGKYRYKDNHAKMVSANDFYNLARTMSRREMIYRGISSRGEKARNILKSYARIDLNNFDYYCPNGGNCYGSNVYTTVQRSYAASYAWGGTMIEGILDTKNAWSMSYDAVCRVQSSINTSAIQTSVATHLQQNGLSPDRAQRIAKAFSNAISQDPGLVAILMGLDYYVADGHQRNLFNLSKWIIKEV